MIGTGDFQLDRTNTSGSNQASAKGSVGHVVNSTTGSFTLRPGTGVRQSDPGNAFPNSTNLRITVNRLDFLATSSPVGALASSYFSFRVAGTNESTAVKSRVTYDLTLRNADTGIVVSQFGPAIREYPGSGTLSFVDTITLGSKLSSAVNTGQRLRISGIFDMQTSLAAAAARPGAGGESFAASTNSIELDDFTIGAGGEIYTYRTAATTQQLFSTAANWRRFDGASVAPNSVLAMAFFPNDRNVDRFVTLDTARTLGHIDAAGSAVTRIDPKGVGQPLTSPALTLGSASLPATVRMGSEAGNGFIELKHLTFGAAADVHTDVAVTTNPQNWSTASGWRRFDGVQAPASGSQHLALMPNDQGLTRTIILDSARTVGVLDVSGSAFTRIQPLLAGNPGGSPALTLGSGSHPATIRVGGEAGNAGLDLNTRVFVGSDLQISSETGLGPLFDATITFNTAGATLAKTGDGNAFIDGPVVANNLRVDHRAGQTFQRSSLIGANAAVGVSGDAASVWRTTVDQSIASLDVSGDAAAVVEGAGRRVLKTRDLHLDPTGNARLDLTDGGLVFDYSTGAEADRLAFIAAEIARARGASGDWTGGGIGSAVARAQPGLYAVGFAPKSAVAGSTFMGVAVDATSILARSTYLGDAALDGSVGIADFSVLAASFNGTGRSWHQGDFTFDGTTDITDFAWLAANFNRVLPADATDAAGWTARGVAAASPPVPEPSVGVAAMAGLTIARRRRRSNR